MRFLATATLAAATLASPLAFALQGYVGLAAGQGKIDGYPLPVQSTITGSAGTLTSFGYSPLEGDDMLLSARAGVRLHPNLAVEAGYYRLGDYTFHAPAEGGLMSGTVRARSYGASLVGIVPLDRLDLYARAGYARTELKGDAAQGNAVATPRERFNEAFYGVGARWKLTEASGVFAEYQRHDKLELDGFFVGVDVRF